MRMNIRAFFMVALLMGGFLLGNRTALAGPVDKIKNIIETESVFQDHIRSAVEDVKKANTPEEKRELLNNSFTDLIKAIDRVEGMKKLSDDEKAALTSFRVVVVEKQDELNGTNGFTPVPDSELNEFADYVQQSLEQADRTLTISLTSALLIIIILILIL